MGKALRTAGTIVAAVAIVVATGGTAALVAGGASLGTAAAAVASATTLGLSTSAWITAGTVLSSIGGALSKPKIGDLGKGSPTDFKADISAGIPCVVGETGVGGQIVRATTAEAKNHLLCYLTVYSAGPIQGFKSFRANGQLLTFVADNAVEAPYHNFMLERHQVGGHTPQPFMPPGVTSGMPEWTTDHKLTGLAARWWCLAHDKNGKVFPTGTPKPLAELYGMLVYDPRLDSTYPGGSGECRAGNEWTYVYSENPYLHALTFAIGRFQNGKRYAGLGAPVAMIDVPAFVDAANIADANGWKIGGVYYTTDRKWEVFKAMLQAGGGWPVPLGAKLSCGINSPKVSLDTLTRDDVVGDATISGAQPKRERWNALSASYRSPAHDYQMVPADPILVPAWIAEDRDQQRTATPEFPLVQQVNQAVQLGMYFVANSRELGPVTLPCKPRWKGYKPGDCITVDEPDFGLVDREMLIIGRHRDWATGIVTLSLVSETAGKHDFALGKTGTPPPTADLDGLDGSYIPPASPGSWEAFGTVLAGPEGSLPAILLTGAADAELISAIIVDCRERLTVGPPATWGDWATVEYPPSTTRIVITGLKPGATYQVRIRYRNTHGAQDPHGGLDLGEHTPGGLIAAGVIGATAADIVAALLAGDQLKEIVDGLAETVMKRAIAQWAKVQDVVARNNFINGVPTVDYTAEHIQYLWILGDFDQAAGSYVMNQARVHTEPGVTFAEYTLAQQSVMDGKVAAFEDTIRTDIDQGVAAAQRTTSLGAWDGDNGSIILNHSNVKWTSGQTLGQYIEGVRSQIGTDLASYDSSIKTWVNGSSAGASWISNLEANFGGDFTGQIVSYASVTSGLGAKYGVTLDVNGWVTGYQINNGGTPATSAFVIRASNFALADPSGGVVYPFAVSGGYATFANPVTIGAGSVKLVLGPAFGASGDLVFWFGPSGTAIAAATKTNGYWAFGTDGKVYYGTGELGTGGGSGMTVGISAGLIQTSGTTTGSVTATGSGGDGSYTYTWSKSFDGATDYLGDPSYYVKANSPTSASTTFTLVGGVPPGVPAGEFVQAGFLVTATDSSGKSASRLVTARFNA